MRVTRWRETKHLDARCPEKLIREPDQTLDQTPDQTLDQTLDQTPDQTLDQTIDQTLDQTPDQTLDQIDCSGATTLRTCWSSTPWEMDVSSSLQGFESRLGSYTGDDPLEPWDKFVAYLEQTLPAGGAGGMSLVFDRLVERFLNVERYANDPRYVNYCIRCASYYPDPAALLSHVYGRGVGTTSAALYVAWAQQLEQRGMHDQAEAVYQKALGNRAQPADAVLSEHRQFQTRTRSQAPASRSSNPLQNSLLTNQMSSHREPGEPNKDSGDGPPKAAAHKTTIIVSRSETSGTIPSSRGAPTVSAYMTEELACEGSELCFEEVRAEKYFRKLREKKAMESRAIKEKLLSQMQEDLVSYESSLGLGPHNQEASGGLDRQRTSLIEMAILPDPGPTQKAFGRPQPTDRLSSRRSLGLRLHTEATFVPEASAVAERPRQQLEFRAADALSLEVSHHAPHLADRSVHLQSSAPTSASTDQESADQTWMVESWSVQQPVGFELHRSAEEGRLQELNTTRRDAVEPEERLNLSQGASANLSHNLSHITPNNSMGFVQATPSRVLPSPTVNTREALDVIMDMFQAPTLLEDPFGNTSPLRAAPGGFGPGLPGNGVSCLTKSTTTFSVFQDETDKENGGAPSAMQKAQPIRALAEISAPNKPNTSPPPDESTTWGARYNSLHSLDACPNSTSDFALQAQCVSTPFTHKAPFNFYEDDQETCDGREAEDEAFIRRQPKKLSPIMEQSPSNDAAFGQLPPSSAAHGTIVGEGIASASHCRSSSSITVVQPPPPAVLSFRDQTPCPARWDVYTSPERASPPSQLPEASVGPQREAFTIMEDLDRPASPERVQRPVSDVPMSPEGAVTADWLAIQSPEPRAEPDLDVFLSPRLLGEADLDVPMSPHQPQLCADEPMSPMPPPPPFSAEDEPMMSPDARGLRPHAADVSMNAAAAAAGGAAAVQLVSDPWDEELISHLLSALTPPLVSHPRCITWQCKVPNICPKTTISMGNASLRVDRVLGEGAFATVYQATDPVTSERAVLKVQKPANPWEFYIHTQLDARLPPAVRHLFGAVRAAHLFHDGSVLLGELHDHGTLLNAVNMYKTLSDKVMPPPLVMYFAVCMLHTVEQLHAARLIHADIKPDNFLLGERFLDNKCFEPENLDHGLVLIDLGQSIDMELFPEGTAFTAKCLTSGFQCTEMLSGKPWSYQTDYFGLAGTVHCMLFGSYMQVKNDGGVWKTNGVFRRNPHSDLWQDFFHALLNAPAGGGGPSPSLRSLRGSLAAALKQNYGSKLSSLKSRMLVLLLENRRAARR